MLHYFTVWQSAKPGTNLKRKCRHRQKHMLQWATQNRKGPRCYRWFPDVKQPTRQCCPQPPWVPTRHPQVLSPSNFVAPLRHVYAQRATAKVTVTRCIHYFRPRSWAPIQQPPLEQFQVPTRLCLLANVRAPALAPSPQTLNNVQLFPPRSHIHDRIGIFPPPVLQTPEHGLQKPWSRPFCRNAVAVGPRSKTSLLQQWPTG